MCRQIAAQVITVVLGVAALGTMLLAAHNVQTYFAFPLSLELRLMRSQLTSGNLRQARSILCHRFKVDRFYCATGTLR
jgi:hypothetical protein